MLQIRLKLVGPSGRDVTGTEEVLGYTFQDFFSSDIQDIVTTAADAYEANEWLRSAYHGPDACGFGVEWDLFEEGGKAA